MENRRLTAFVVVAGMVFGLGFVASLPAKEVDPQDQGTSIGNVPEAIIEIPAMTVPSVTLDFDLMAAGPTSVAAIQAQFPSAMSDMAFSPCTGSIPGTYDTQPNGRALAADPSGSLGLYLVNPGGGFGCFDDLTVNFSQQITEFGVQIGDWIGPMNIIVFDGATNVGQIQIDTSGAPLTFLQSDVPFDSLVITAFPDNPGANYVFPTLVFPEGGPPSIAYLSHDGTDDCPSNPANVNGIWEPGEEIALDVEVVAGGDFTGVTGTLVPLTPDVFVPGDTTSWPDLTGGVPAWSNSPFQVVLGQTVECYTRVQFELTLNANEGGPWVYTFGNEIGEPLMPNVPVAIPDNDPGNPGVSDLVVGDDVTLADVNVWVRIDHTWVGDVAISLRSPSGTEIVLLDRPGVPAGTFGCSDNNMDITFDDSSAFDPENHCAGTDPWYTGDAMPVQALAAFIGESTMGTWQLRATDSAGGDTGEIVDWELITDPPIGGTCVICEPAEPDQAIPTLNTLGILVLIGILVGAGLVMIRRT